MRASLPVRLWVPETRLTSCDLLIFVKETAEPIVSADADGVLWLVSWQRAHESGLTERAVGAVPVEVVLIVGQGRYGVGLVDDEDAVEEFTSDAADESLGDRVRPWCSNWGLDHLSPSAGEDGVERSGELGVAIADEEPEALGGVVEVPW
jgi:hypothetical protein